MCYNNSMDMEKRARRQSRRIIISEILMVFTVVVTVLILAFVVSGYWVGSDFKIERQGLLQIYSAPTGADIEVDGNPSSWLQRTNTSKTLTAGKHTIKLTKEGYDSWSRTVNIVEGLLYRLHYPRLFLNERFEETAYTPSASSAFVTPDRNFMLLANNTTSWELINLDTENTKSTPLDLSGVLPFTSRAEGAKVGLFSGTIAIAEWASDNEHLLLKLQQEDKVNWVLINVKNPSLSVNLSKEFNTDFAKIKILDQSANNLLVILNGNIHRIDVPSKQISAVLLSNVKYFDYYEQDIVYVAKDTETNKYYVGLNKLGSDEIIKLKEDLDAPVRVVITKFYDDEYIGLVSEDSIHLYIKKDFREKSVFSLSFNPENIKVAASGDGIIMFSDGKIATLDMEANELYEWSTDTNIFGWLDSSMVYAVKDGTLNVYDFNGFNHRTLSSNVSSHFPVTITADKYLYYFRDGALIREYLIEK